MTQKLRKLRCACDMTHPCVTWLIHMCGMTHFYVWHDSFLCVTWRIHMCGHDMTHSYVWYNSSMSVTWIFHLCIHVYVHMCTRIYVCIYTHLNTCINPHIYIYVCVCVSACMYIYIYIYTWILLEFCANACICKCIRLAPSRAFGKYIFSHDTNKYNTYHVYAYISYICTKFTLNVNMIHFFWVLYTYI